MFSLTINLPEVAPSLYRADTRYPSGLQVTLHSTEVPPTRTRSHHASTINNESSTLDEATQCGASRPCLARAQNASTNSCSSDIGTLRFTAQGSTLPGNSIRISTDNSTGTITFDSHLTFSPPSRPQSARISYGKPLSGSPYRKVGSHGLCIQPLDSDSHTFEPAAPQEAQSSLSGGIADQRGPAGPQDSASTMPIRSARGSSKKAAPDASPEIRVDRRREHAIRGRKEKIIWHASRGDAELLAPPMPPAAANLADVYVHVVEGRSSPQVWLRMEPLAWVEAAGGHAHPTLDGYVLHLLLSGEPRWVQRKYYQRYRSLLRKRGKLLPEASVFGST